MKYCRLDYRGDSAEPDRTWLEENVKKFPCKHRDAWNKFYDPIVVEYLDSSHAYGAVRILDTHYFRVDFLDIILPEIKRIKGVRFGELISSKSNKVLERWKTCWFPEDIYLRGTKDVRFWQCQVCGMIRYDSHFEEQYLVEADVRGRSIVKGGPFLFISQTLYEKLQSHPDWKTLKRKIIFEETEVLKTPRDGFPAKLSTIKPPILDPEEVYRLAEEKAKKVRQERQMQRKRIKPILTPEQKQKKAEALVKMRQRSFEITGADLNDIFFEDES